VRGRSVRYGTLRPDSKLRHSSAIPVTSWVCLCRRMDVRSSRGLATLLQR